MKSTLAYSRSMWIHKMLKGLSVFARMYYIPLPSLSNNKILGKFYDLTKMTEER